MHSLTSCITAVETATRAPYSVSVRMPKSGKSGALYSRLLLSTFSRLRMMRSRSARCERRPAKLESLSNSAISRRRPVEIELQIAELGAGIEGDGAVAQHVLPLVAALQV